MDQPPPSPQRPRSSVVRVVALVGAIVLLGVLSGRSVLVMVAAFAVMIGLHELGHYLTARWAGMKVTEFFLGFGPRIWSIQRGETEYGLKAIPAGAYVKIIGMSNLESVDPEDEARAYRQKSYPRRLSVAVAGSTMHFLLALALIFALLVGFGRAGGSLFGDRDESTWVVGEVAPGAGAQDAGLIAGDKLVSVAGQPTVLVQDLVDAVSPRLGETVTVVVQRGGQELSMQAPIRLKPGTVDKGYLGVTPKLAMERLTPWAAVPAAGQEFASLVTQSLSSMQKLFTPTGVSGFVRQVARGDADTSPESPSGSAATSQDEGSGRLVSIYGATRLGAVLLDDGVGPFLGFLAMLNVFIGMFNLVPLLPLDGGHVVIATYERIREGRSGRRYFADLTKMLPLTYAVVVLLVGIFISSLYLDIVSPIPLR